MTSESLRLRCRTAMFRGEITTKERKKAVLNQLMADSETP
jgi:hypothetical protein